MTSWFIMPMVLSFITNQFSPIYPLSLDDRSKNHFPSLPRRAFHLDILEKLSQNQVHHLNELDDGVHR